MRSKQGCTLQSVGKHDELGTTRPEAVIELIGEGSCRPRPQSRAQCHRPTGSFDTRPTLCPTARAKARFLLTESRPDNLSRESYAAFSLAAQRDAARAVKLPHGFLPSDGARATASVFLDLTGAAHATMKCASASQPVSCDVEPSLWHRNLDIENCRPESDA